MKIFLTIVALSLQLSGAWPHLSPQLHSRLATAALPAPAPHIATISVPLAVAAQTPLKLEAGTSVYAVDVDSGAVLYAQNADKPRPIASITKLMTVMVALSVHQPDDMVSVGQLPNYDVADETMGLKTGERFRLIDLVKAALIPSDNDAADALAITTSGSVTKFAAAMNAKARDWDIRGVHFNNATGLIDTGNTATATAVAKIAALDLTSPIVRQIVNNRSDVIKDADGRTFNLASTDDLLATGRFYGIKTGYTLAAGECFVGLTKVSGHEVITVVLGSSNRFGETQSLVNWIGQNWIWQ